MNHEYWMRMALDLAERGRGWVEPNPMVGCCVVDDQGLLASGFHERFGGPHAEVNAIRSCDRKRLAESTIYVTLEPCSHFGKTPPCVDLLLDVRPKRVVIAMEDPFPAVSGRGIQSLRSSGIEVIVGVLEKEARILNAAYLKKLSTGLPWVIAKWAMTLDGAIATRTGESKWITNETSRKAAHRRRSQMDAVMVGIGTVLADDPMLNARPAQGESVPRQPMRVVLDRNLRIPESSQLVQTANQLKTVVFTSEDCSRSSGSKKIMLEELGVEIVPLSSESKNDFLQNALGELGKMGCTNLLIEGGAAVLGTAFDSKCVDQIECYIAAKILGCRESRRPIEGEAKNLMNQLQELTRIAWQELDGDIVCRGFLR